MDERKNLFVKIQEPEDRDNIDFVAFANNANVSDATRMLFSQEAQRLKTERPDLWQAYILVTRKREKNE